MLKLMQFYFKWLSKITPDLSSYLATKIFYTPQKTRQSKTEIAAENRGHQNFFITSQGKLKTILWASANKYNKTVLLAHGWGGRGTQLYRFIQPLLKNYNVVTFDGPAHGASSGKITTLPRYALALAEICKKFDVSYIIGHSFGAGATAIAVARHDVQVERVVLIAPPYSVENVVNNFCRYMKIPEKIAEKVHQRMESSKWHGMPRINLSFSSLGPKIKIPVLVFHSRDDRYIDYRDGKLASNCLIDAKFIALDGLGHYRPISNERVIEVTIDFISQNKKNGELNG